MFEIGFRVEVDPEFPADGGQEPERIPPGLPQIGAVLRVTAPDHEPWDIAVGAPNWWRTPVPMQLAFISDRHGYVVDVVERRVLHELLQAIRIWEAQESDLLLLISSTGIMAIGPDGLAWRNDELVRDDLKVTASRTDRILCRGWDDAGFVEFELDPATGSRLG